MRFLIKLLFICLLFTFTYLPAFAKTSTKYFLDGTWYDYTNAPIYLKINGSIIESDVPPLIFNNRSLVPVRATFEKLGAKVFWDDRQGKVLISFDKINIVLKINDSKALVNNVEHIMDIPPKIINDRTLIPVRFVAEALGFDVQWLENGRTIIINSDSNINKVDKDINIINSSYKIIGKTLRVSISADAKINKYTSMELSNSPRLLVDIHNSIINITDKDININYGEIIKLRSAQNNNNPNITRFVVDMNSLIQYKIYLSEDAKTLFIDFALSKENSNTNSNKGNDINKIANKIVVIDPGHGGEDPGAVYGGINEKDLNLTISTILYDMLKKEGIKVYITRKTDKYLTLKERTDYANSLDATLFISIHNNAMSDINYNGTMTLYYNSDKNSNSKITSKRFAEIIQEKIVDKLGTKDLGLRERPALVVLNSTNMTSALAEIAYMTNSDDLEKLKNRDFLVKAAEALREAILKALYES